MATINNLASDMPDLQFTASMLGRTMARPTTRSWSKFKKAARYLKYEYHDVTMDEVKVLVDYSDSDWAGCKRSRRSMSGGIIVVGGAVIKSWSNRQATVALSSGRGRVLLGRESRSGVDRHQVDDEGHGLGRGHQAACRCDCSPGVVESPGDRQDSASGSQIFLVTEDDEERSDCNEEGERCVEPGRCAYQAHEFFRRCLASSAVCICIATLAFTVRSRGCRHNVTPVGFCSAFSFLFAHATQCIQFLVDLIGSSCKTVVPLTLPSLEFLLDGRFSLCLLYFQSLFLFQWRSVFFFLLVEVCVSSCEVGFFSVH